MKQKELSVLLKSVAIGVGLCGIVVYALLIPFAAKYMVENELMDAKHSLPWMITIWISAVPCFFVLAKGWGIASDIGANRSFSRDNADRLKAICYLALIDTVYFFVINTAEICLRVTRPLVMAAAVVICCFGTAFAICAAALSHLVTKAAEIQEENELTV
ncbi:MAG: DUF2975 domain-containing protein [Lachnospiraceae bacterium]|nr:DUF2975 domain-containing protein [Lachnospiraceae bacterium]